MPSPTFRSAQASTAAVVSASASVAAVASGAKPGGLNTPLYFYFVQPGLIPAPFTREYVTDYEVGWKFDDHLHLQFGGYHNIFQHFQVTVPLGSVPTKSAEQNVPSRTKLYEFEDSAQAVLGDLSLYAGLGLEHSQLGDFYTIDTRTAAGAAFKGTCMPTTGPASGACVNLAGHPQTYAPDLTFNVGAYYDVRLDNGDKLTPGLTYSHISDQWATLYENPVQSDYLASRHILNASLAWTRGTYVVTLYGYNVTDDHYVSAVASPLRIAGAPLQVGVSIMKTF